MALSATLKVDIHNDRVSLQAEQVSLISVLEDIAEIADISLETGDPLTKPISLELSNVSVEESIRRLLAKHSYTLIFKRLAGARFAITEIRVIAPGKEGKGQQRPVPRRIARVDAPTKPTPSPPRPVVPSPQAALPDPFRRYERDGFRQEFENIDRIADEILVDAPNGPTLPEGAPIPVDGPVPSMHRDPPQPGGMRIKEVVVSSVFAQIGLKDGDVIRDVNGKQVTTKGGLIRALQEASEERSVIRIARANEDGMMDPIYIQLNSPDSPAPADRPPAAEE